LYKALIAFVLGDKAFYLQYAVIFSTILLLPATGNKVAVCAKAAGRPPAKQFLFIFPWIWNLSVIF